MRSEFFEMNSRVQHGAGNADPFTPLRLAQDDRVFCGILERVGDR
jgi:hypothetical protein